VGNGLEDRRLAERRKAELPLAAGADQLMVALLLRQVVVDGADRSGGRLEAGVERVCQGREALTKIERVLQRRAVAVQAKTLGLGPAQDGRLVRQQVRRCWTPASRSVHEVEPDGVAQKGEFED
jgi:hypothetical protein